MAAPLMTKTARHWGETHYPVKGLWSMVCDCEGPRYCI